MRYSCFLLSLFLFLLSCSGKNKLPPDVMTIDQLKSIIWDLELSGEAADDKYSIARDSLRMEATSLFQQVFTKHKMDKKAFYHSFSYYESHPDLMKVLLDSVNSYGGREKQKLYQRSF